MTNPENDVNSPLWQERRERLFQFMQQRWQRGEFIVDDETHKEMLRILGVPESVVERSSLTHDESGIQIRIPYWEPEQP